MAQCEGIQANSSIGMVFDEIFEFIQSFQTDSPDAPSMFDKKKKTAKREVEKDSFQKAKEQQILRKYRLFEYIDEK